MSDFERDVNKEDLSQQQIIDRAIGFMNEGRVPDLKQWEDMYRDYAKDFNWAYAQAHAQAVSNQNQANLKQQAEQQAIDARKAQQAEGEKKRQEYWNKYSEDATSFANDLEKQAKYYQDPANIQAALDLAQQRARATLASEYSSRGLSGTSYASRAMADATMATQESTRKLIEERMQYANSLRSSVASIKQGLSQGAESMYQYDRNLDFNYQQLDQNKKIAEEQLAFNKQQYLEGLRLQEEALRRQQKSSIFSGLGTLAGLGIGIGIAATGGAAAPMLLAAGSLGATAGGTVGGIAGGGNIAGGGGGISQSAMNMALLSNIKTDTTTQPTTQFTRPNTYNGGYQSPEEYYGGPYYKDYRNI